MTHARTHTHTHTDELDALPFRASIRLSHPVHQVHKKSDRRTKRMPMASVHSKHVLIYLLLDRIDMASCMAWVVT